MHEFSGLQNPSSCHWSDEFQKITTFCRKIVLPGFWGTCLYQSTLFDLANTVLAKQKLCRDHMHELRGLENPSSCHWSDEFQKITTFCRKIVLPVFWGTWLYQSTLFDLANTILASKGPVETICKNSVGYRTHRAVTGPMSFKKSRRFVGKPCSRDFGAPGYNKALYLTLQTLFWPKKSCLETICMSSEGSRTHRAVTGPMSFKKSRHFVGKPCSRVLGRLAAIQAH